MAANSSLVRPGCRVCVWTILGIVLVGTGVLALAPAGREYVDGAIGWARDTMERHSVAGALVFFLFSALSAMLSFASSTVLVPSATLAWGQALTFLLLWGGWVSGAMAAFGIGRLAYPLLRHAGYARRLRTYRHYASRHMKFWMLLLVCLAIPSEIPGYLFGSLQYPFLKFLAAITLAEGAYALGVVIAGERLLMDDPLPFLALIGLMVAGAALAGWLLRLLARSRP